MQLSRAFLFIVMAASCVMTFPLQGQSKNAKVVRRSLKDKVLRNIGLPGEVSEALLSNAAGERSVSQVRRKRTLAHLQVAWTLHVECTDYPSHPDCTADVIDDDGGSYRSRHRKRHHRRNRNRTYRQ